MFSRIINTFPRFRQSGWMLKSRERIAVRENELSNSKERINNLWERILNPRERIAQFDIAIYLCYFLKFKSICPFWALVQPATQVHNVVHWPLTVFFLLFFIGLFVWGWGVAVQNQFFGVDVSSLRVQLNENKIKFLITVRPVKLTTDNNVSLKREENGMGVFREVL